MPGREDRQTGRAPSGGVALAGLWSLSGCVERQSTLHPAGREAAEVAELFWIMTAGGAVIWTVVMGITLYAVLGRRRPATERFADRFILAGGVVFPTVVLAALLTVGLTLLPGWREVPPDLRVHVEAEQFWWRVSYERAGGGRVESANEVHLPQGARVEFVLTSKDVIHSFWIPALGGKMDTIPGRETRLVLSPEKTGRYRGVCAEFCGLSHALMAFEVTVHSPADFEAWLEAESRPAQADAGPLRRAGCAACHTVRGVTEVGRLGPDLTHLASRSHIAAGLLPLTEADLRLWLEHPQSVKPGVHMPPFNALPPDELDALVAYLMALK